MQFSELIFDDAGFDAALDVIAPRQTPDTFSEDGAIAAAYAAGRVSIF